jgi:hypothetical protein
MDTLVWIVMGGGVGWVGYSHFGLNGYRSRNVSIILGAVGAVIGVLAIAPLFVTLPASGLSVGGVFFALAAAAGALALGNLASARWGI